MLYGSFAGAAFVRFDLLYVVTCMVAPIKCIKALHTTRTSPRDASLVPYLRKYAVRTHQSLRSSIGRAETARGPDGGQTRAFPIHFPFSIWEVKLEHEFSVSDLGLDLVSAGPRPTWYVLSSSP